MTTTVLSKDEPAASHGRPGPAEGMVPLAEMAANARAASRFLKALSNPKRLLLLCLLSEREKTVSEREAALGLRQPAISQQLGRLRAEGLVAGRRDGKLIHYRLASDEARRIMLLLYELFCQSGAQGTGDPIDLDGLSAANPTAPPMCPALHMRLDPRVGSWARHQARSPYRRPSTRIWRTAKQ